MTRLTYEQYAQIDGINWSTLKDLRRSPLHYQHRLATPHEDTPALALGRAVHCAVFEPDELPLRYVVYTENKSRGEGARKKWEAFQAANTDRTILSAEDWRTVCAIRDAVRKDPNAAELLRHGQAEHTIRWTDPTTGLACKARLDWLGLKRRPGDAGPVRTFDPSVIVDLKTSRTADPRRFATQAASLGYHGQLAFYRRGIVALTGREIPVRLIAVESEPPHDVVVYRPDDDWLDEGDALVGELLEQVRTRRASGCWPGMALGQEVELTLPRWALPDSDGWTVEEEKT